jgi:hypothetical protein
MLMRALLGRIKRMGSLGIEPRTFGFYAFATAEYSAAAL